MAKNDRVINNHIYLIKAKYTSLSPVHALAFRPPIERDGRRSDDVSLTRCFYFGYTPSSYSLRSCFPYELERLFGIQLLLDVVIRPNCRHGSTDCKTNRFVGLLPAHV